MKKWCESKKYFHQKYGVSVTECSQGKDAKTKMLIGKEHSNGRKTRTWCTTTGVTTTWLAQHVRKDNASGRWSRTFRQCQVSLRYVWLD